MGFLVHFYDPDCEVAAPLFALILEIQIIEK